MNQIPTTAIELLDYCTDAFRVFWITDGRRMIGGKGDDWYVVEYDETHEWVKDICKHVSEAEAVAAMIKDDEL